jgi:hypothetical protein
MIKALMMILNTNLQKIINRIKIWRFGMKKKISYQLIKWIIRKKENLKLSLIKSILNNLFNKVKNHFQCSVAL